MLLRKLIHQHKTFTSPLSETKSHLPITLSQFRTQFLVMKEEGGKRKLHMTWIIVKSSKPNKTNSYSNMSVPHFRYIMQCNMDENSIKTNKNSKFTL